MERKLEQYGSGIIKVVLFGPESTGKTTLARSLAAYYSTLWVPEYMRTYLQDKWDEKKELCKPEDLLPIAEGQMAMENELSEKADRILFCDTDLLELAVYSEAYYHGFCDPQLKSAALKNNYDLYFLTYIDVPWEEDDLRDKPNEREPMFERFRNALIENNRPFEVISGRMEERLELAIAHIDKIIKRR